MYKITQAFLPAALAAAVLLLLPISRGAAYEPIPVDASQLNSWFDRQIGASGPRSSSVDPPLAAAEGKATVIRVAEGGGGDFKTVTDAVKSVPDGNTNRVVISIGPGNYTEKVTIPRTKPYVTLYGDPKNPPALVYGGTAAKYGTVDSATLIVLSDFFTAVNLKVVNSAPRPDGLRKGAQAVALRISGNAAAFYNCKFYGFQDTICDDKGKHLFKDCYIEGTVDFIFGSGTSLYLNSELHVIPGDPMAMITAHARSKADEPTGFVFAHCKVTGTGGTAYLGRSWFPSPRVVYAYSELSDAVNPEGWSDNHQPSTDRTVYFGEYNNKGPGASFEKRVPFAKKLSDGEAKSFLSLAYVEGAKWLLPPHKA
ncbi:Pectinesterase PPME1 [Striga hermonthica]|uniref:Pectinesterase n=1 Tax=Striga hermonthica TaxID=68872 RepID=A0A9N7NV17_STRHE|nr:Pectinesterase PPME1 [Striga hermonthica]